MSKKTIAIINMGYIGDVLNVAPVSRALKLKYPEAKIVVITAPGSVKTAKYLPGIDDSVAFDRYDKHKGLKIFKFAFDFRQKYKIDTAVILTENFRSAMLAFLIGAKTRVGRSCDGRDFLLTKKIPFTEEEQSLNVHVTKQYVRVLAPLGIKVEDYSLDFKISEKAKNRMEEVLQIQNPEGKKLIGICPATGTNGNITAFKCWTIDETYNFIRKINESGTYKVVMVGQDACAYYAEEVRKKGENNFIDLTNKTSIPELAAVISLFEKYVSVDSAPMHMAFAVKTPAVCLFFQGNNNKWGPNDTKHNVCLLNSFISADEVIENANRLERYGV